MTDQEKINKILDLTNKITQNYLVNDKFGQIKVLKAKIKDFLTDPLWNDKLVFQLKQELEDLKLSEEELKSLLDTIENTLEINYENNLKRNTHVFEGKIREYEKKLIDFFVRVGKLKGQNNVLATIIGCLLIHKEEGLTQDQIKELTELSKGAISTNLRILEKSPVVTKELMRGTRKYIYSFGGDFSSLASNTALFKTDTNQKATNFLQAKSLELENLKDKTGYNILSQRIDGILDFLKIHRNLIKIITESDFIKNLEGKQS